jgi:hypothetical protein
MPITDWFLRETRGVINFLQFYGILGSGEADIWQVSQSHISSVSNMISGDSSLTALVGVTFEHNNSEAGLLSSQELFKLASPLAKWRTACLCGAMRPKVG